MSLAYLGGTTTDERLHVIYLALIGPAAALPALLLLDRLEQWALVRRRPALRAGRSTRPTGRHAAPRGPETR